MYSGRFKCTGCSQPCGVLADASRFVRRGPGTSCLRIAGGLRLILTRRLMGWEPRGTWIREWSRRFASAALLGAETGWVGVGIRCTSSFVPGIEEDDQP